MMKFASLKRMVKALDHVVLHDRLASLRGKAPIPDLAHICLDISGRCNLNCRTCSLRHSQTKTLPVHLSDELLHKLAKVIPRIYSMDLQCNCEPLLHPKVSDIITYIKRLNPYVFLALVTNGTMLNADLTRQLIASGLDRIGFSLDGATAHTHERIRRGSRFVPLIDAIRTFVTYKQQQGAEKPKTEIVTVASKENIHELSDLLRLASDLGIESVCINGLEPYTEEMAQVVLYNQTEIAEYKFVFDELSEIATTLSLDLHLPSLALQPYTCCHLQSCVIHTDGTVSPCSVLSYERPYYYLKEPHKHPFISFGSIADKDFLKIWNSKEYRLFRKTLSKEPLPPYCQHCLMQHRVLCPM